jgi:NTP pyrophosphatase (non-canonical NTP hydrolase)
MSNLSLTDWQERVHTLAREKGWWEDASPDVSAKFLLMATEVHEAFEEWRNNHPLTEIYEHPDKPGKPEGVPIELADVVIRVMDFCQWAGIDLEAAVERKHQYNATRSHRHGGKRV